MNKENAASSYENFLINFGKILFRTNLYDLSHPLVQESIQASFESVSGILENKDAAEIAYSEGKILFDGLVVKGFPTVQSALIQFLDGNHLYSVTFKNGVTLLGLQSFCKLFKVKKGEFNKPEHFINFLETEGVSHIVINTAFYSKYNEKVETAPNAPFLPPAGFSEGSDLKKAALAEFIENMSLDSMIWEVTQSAESNPDSQRKIYETIFKQIQRDVNAQIDNATRAVTREKNKIINEQARTESVIQTMAEGVVMVDHDGKIVMMNSVAEKIYGKSFADLKGRQVKELPGEEFMVAVSNEITSPTDRPINREVSVQSKLTTQRTIRQSSAKIENPDGKMVGMLSILNDIEKQKELQQMQDQFMANITHELRTPLSAIKAVLGTFVIDPSLHLNASHKTMMDIANSNIDRLGRLVNDVLDFAKVSDGKISVNPTLMDTEKFVIETVQGLQPWAQTRQVSLEYKPTGNVPKVSADSDRVTQVLVNLVSNAIKFSPKGGKVVLSTERSPIMVKVLITDSGLGIPKKDQEKIFSKFFQIKQMERLDLPGTGLGLFISKKIVDLHQGEIGFTSEEGKGTTFWFALPLIPEAMIHDPLRAAESKSVVVKKSWLQRLFGR